MLFPPLLRDPSVVTLSLRLFQETMLPVFGQLTSRVDIIQRPKLPLALIISGLN